MIIMKYDQQSWSHENSPLIINKPELYEPENESNRDASDILEVPG